MNDQEDQPEDLREGKTDMTESRPEVSNEETKEQVRQKKRIRRRVRSLLIKLVAGTVILYAGLTFVFGIHYVRGNSMYPMVKDGDLLITYKLDPYAINDAVCYEFDGRIYVGRIVAREGMEVNITDTQILNVNSYQPAEEIFYPTPAEGSAITYPYTVKENSVFVLNDYRSDLSDSRTFGSVPVSSLRGKIAFVFRRRGI